METESHSVSPPFARFYPEWMETSKNVAGISLFCCRSILYFKLNLILDDF